MGLKKIDYYSTNPVPYPVKEDFGRVFVYKKGQVILNGVKREEITDLDMAKYRRDNCHVEYDFDDASYRVALNAHLEEDARLLAEFKADLFDEHGVTGHPRAEKCFSIAWGYGHGSGYSEVANYFSDFVDLIK